MLYDSTVIKIILKTLIQGKIIESITILGSNTAKIAYNIGNQENEQIVNFKSRVRSFSINVPIKNEN